DEKSLLTDRFPVFFRVYPHPLTPPLALRFLPPFPPFSSLPLPSFFSFSFSFLSSSPSSLLSPPFLSLPFLFPSSPPLSFSLSPFFLLSSFFSPLLSPPSPL
ncbi:hypothetical protein ACXWRS_09675, partial [Streptococcus pyogenes]